MRHTLTILAVLLVVYVASQLGGLFTLNWLLDNFLSSIILVIVVIFQADIRRALAHMGRNPFFADQSFTEEDAGIDELVKGCTALAARRCGALVVIERETGINDFVEIGREIDAKLSGDLLSAIFHPQSPIHDGAVVIQGGRLTRAGCFLPLTQNPNVSHRLGTRHRAAIGLTEMVDAVAIVVSEETGKVSVVIPIASTGPLFSLILTAIFLRDVERVTVRIVLSAVLIVGGVVLSADG